MNDKNGATPMLVAIVASVVVAILAAFMGYAVTHRVATPSNVNCMTMFDAPGFSVVPSRNPETRSIEVHYADGRVVNYPADQPFVVTRDMENARVGAPFGSRFQYTKHGLNTESLELRSYDDTAFIKTDLPGGFQLQVRDDIPQGRARTTDVRVDDGKLFWFEYAFTG
jgi:hypothetical protein